MRGRDTDQRLRLFSKAMRHDPTDAEAVLWSELRGRRLGRLKFRRQEVIGKHIVDFVCFERKLIVEVDGSQHADNQYDLLRDQELTRRGFQILRFWNSEILTSFDQVCLQILKTVNLAEAEKWR